MTKRIFVSVTLTMIVTSSFALADVPDRARQRRPTVPTKWLALSRNDT